jgi:SPP1 gp7 family putative phage head morphogenesis protein
MSAWRQKNRNVQIRQSIISQLATPLQGSMLAAHIQGERRSVLMASQARPDVRRKIAASALYDRVVAFSAVIPWDDRAICLGPASVFDQVLQTLEMQKRSDYDRLQRQYQTQALKIWNKTADSIEEDLRQTIGELISGGAHNKEGVDVLREKFDSLGLTETKGYQLEAIFRTQTQLGYGAGRWQADQDKAIQEILWGYEYSAIHDDRTRPTHWAMDGTRAEKDDSIWRTWWPPSGWNCRCVAVPIFEDAKPIKPPKEIDGMLVVPDKGFAFNPGQVFSTVA